MTVPLERRSGALPISRTFTVFAVIFFLGLVVLVTLMVLVLRLNAVADVNRRNGQYVIECTTPGPKPPPVTGNKCFDDGQARTAGAVAQIIDVNGNGVPDMKDLADALGVDLKGTP